MSINKITTATVMLGLFAIFAAVIATTIAPIKLAAILLWVACLAPLIPTGQAEFLWLKRKEPSLNVLIAANAVICTAMFLFIGIWRYML